MKDLKNILLEKLVINSHQQVDEKLVINSYQQVDEKLVINKDSISASNSLRDVSNIDIDWRLKACFSALSTIEKSQLMERVEYSYKEKKNPKRLFNSKTKPYMMANLYACAILCEWDEAIEIIRKDILDKTNYKLIYFGPQAKNDNFNCEDMLDAYIYGLYKKIVGNPCETTYLKNSNQSKDEIDAHFEHYFKLYNIKY